MLSEDLQQLSTRLTLNDVGPIGIVDVKYPHEENSHVFMYPPYAHRSSPPAALLTRRVYSSTSTFLF